MGRFFANFRGRSFAIFATLVSAGVAVLLSAAQAAEAPPPKYADAPCIPGSNEEEIKRAKASGPRAGERSCKDVLKEAQQKVEHRVRQQAEWYYNGCDLDPTKPADANGCKGTPVPKETCNVLDAPGVPKTFNQHVESEQNHPSSLMSEVSRPSSKCGDWPYFSAHMSGRTCRITPDYTRTTHYIEDAFNRGAWIQALNCYHNQVQAEVAKGKLRLTTVKDSAGNEVPGPCAVMATEYVSLRQTSEQVAKEMQAKFSGQDNIGDIDYCAGDDGKTDSSNFADTDPDAGKHRQSACQLRTSRRSLEAMFMQLAACEVWTRAGRSYESFLGSSPGRDLVKEQARAAINGIRSKSRSLCSHNRILNSYYIPRYMNAFTSKANGIWNASSCAALPE